MLLVIIVLLIFLNSFLTHKHRHVLNVYFGVPGSGKTTFAAWLTKRALKQNRFVTWCQKHDNAATRRLLNSKYFKRHIDVYSNVPITGAYMLDCKKDLGISHIENAKIIIDEAGIEFNNRFYKTFPESAIYFFKYHRHYRTSIDVFSQSFDDMDITLRRLAQNYFVVKKSLVPFCVVCRRIRRRVGIDDTTHQIIDEYYFDLPVIGTRRIFSPPLWKLFNSYSCKQLPPKFWTKW